MQIYHDLNLKQMKGLSYKPEGIVKEFPISFDFREELLDYACGKAEAAALPKTSIFHLKIAIDEVFTNLISHSGLREHETVILQFEDLNPGLSMTIIDRGMPFDPFEHTFGEGYGIQLILKLMDSVHYRRENETNYLTLIKR